MEQKKTHPTTPHFGRQVNKSDKNEIVNHGDTIGKSEADQTALIEIPKKYEKIIQATLEFCEKREAELKNEDYLEFCNKIKNLWRTIVKDLNNKTRKEAEKREILYPMIYLLINETKVFLTREDMMILLEYPFNVNSRHILLTLKKLNIKTLRGLHPRITMIYQWNLVEEWKGREGWILREYWNTNNYQWETSREIKDKIYREIEEGKFDKELKEIRARIAKNHEID